MVKQDAHKQDIIKVLNLEERHTAACAFAIERSRGVSCPGDYRPASQLVIASESVRFDAFDRPARDGDAGTVCAISLTVRLQNGHVHHCVGCSGCACGRLLLQWQARMGYPVPRDSRHIHAFPDQPFVSPIHIHSRHGEYGSFRRVADDPEKVQNVCRVTRKAVNVRRFVN
jgi:hypothetical protein